MKVDLRSLTQPVGIIRLAVTFLTCTTFSLVATAGSQNLSYWAYCMFTWCFCFFFTLLIIILEFTTFNGKLPFAWEDFTAAFAMLASLMCLITSIIYPTFFTCPTCDHQIAASVLSWLCFGLYVGEVVLTHRRPSGQNSGFLSTLPGIMKILETFVACLIFVSLEPVQNRWPPELQWCVAVYSLCFIFSIVIILLTLAQVTSLSPVSFDKVVVVYNLVATVMYATATVIWPLYGFRGQGSRPSDCGHHCPWDKLVVVTFMTIFNFIIYAADAGYSVYLVFFVSRQ